MRIRWIAVAVGLALAAVAGCSSSSNSTGPGPSPSPNPSLVALIKAANLDRCPTSSVTPVSGGLPNYTLLCLGNGPAVHLAGLSGKPMVVNLWGSWCEPCQAEEKYLSSAYDATKRHVGFLGVDTIDDADSALDFDAHVSPPVHFPSVSDPDKHVLLALHFQGPPETIYLDASGKIVHINTVPYTSTAAITADIARYLHVST